MRNRITKRATTSRNKRPPIGPSQLLKDLERKGRLIQSHKNGRVRWSPTPMAMFRRRRSEKLGNKMLKIVKGMESRGLMSHELRNGKRRWFPTEDGLKAGLGSTQYTVRTALRKAGVLAADVRSTQLVEIVDIYWERKARLSTRSDPSASPCTAEAG